MCYIWKNPTDPDYEIDFKTLEKLPNTFDYLNITGGEPTLRKDLMEICDLLNPKTKKLEISTNGLHVDKLVPIVKKYPDIKIRISLDGIGETNNAIRGEKGGYQKKIEAMDKLIEAGGCDLGFATTFQDENVDQILEIYRYTRKLNIELATSALHNAFQFHKNNNTIYERVKVAKKVEELITEMLKSFNVKNWFRAYLNLGLIHKILGHDRLHACTQGTDNIFVDPWGDVYACNVRNDLLMGNIKNQEWDDIYTGTVAKEIRAKVAGCTQNCWMVSSAKTAMRNKLHPKLPRTSVLLWVVYNKLKLALGSSINFEKYVNYNDVKVDVDISKRVSYLSNPDKKSVQPKESPRYTQLKSYFNR
jgi:MoaA/NifB/PqqE/SkfB family radical SAM enzyme